MGELKQAANLEQELVERAQQGDTEAFGELIARHRSKAKGWAERMTGDPYMADDVVQDALIRAFMHLGTLSDSSRFLPWLHRIVQNQANMRLRRGGPFRREKPFAAYSTAASDASRVDWDNLDEILFHLTRSAADKAMKEQDPAEHLMRKELYETIHALLHCLNRKERGIFEAYFFRQLAPDEIAAMYQMTVGSVYTYIHRSRQKLRKEQSRISLSFNTDQKGASGMVRCKVLSLPEWSAHCTVRSTFVDRIGLLLASLGDRREISWLMGISGFAFRMKLSNKTTYADGIYVFDWRRELTRLMNELGYEVKMVCGQLASSPVPLLGAVERFPVVLPIEEAIIPFIRKSIDLGKPVLYFDTLVSKPYVHEWSLIYGYDDDLRLVYLTDPMMPEGKTLSYEDIAENPVRYAAAVEGKLDRIGINKKHLEHKQAERAIRFAVRYARSGCDYVPMTIYLSYSSGLGAYPCWINHLGEDRMPNRYGMGQLAAVYAEARRHAALFLRGVPLSGEAARMSLLASEAYEQAAKALDRLSEFVPFVRSSEILSKECCEAGKRLLEQAKEFETAAIGYLEQAINEMEKEN